MNIFGGIVALLQVAIVSAPLFAFTTASAEVAPDWSEGAAVPLTGRANPYDWDAKTLQEKIRAGKLHALNYPVAVTGLKMPARPTLKTLDLKPGDPFFGLLKTLLRLQGDFRDFRGFWNWLGLHDYPAAEGTGDAAIPFKDGARPEYPMGVTIADWDPRGQSKVITLSCAACHVGSMFGRPILGLTNRFPGSNEFFQYAQDTFHKIPPGVFRAMTGATRAETALYAESREHIRAVGIRMPQAYGLDTSLAQVALSLAKREPGGFAERSARLEKEPRRIHLTDHPADSKPVVWWSTKYKNRWLADGSIVSGNPIFTVLLWNEIGRGADLRQLDEWTSKNMNVVDELATMVFASKPPRWSEYLPASAAIHVERARRGEAVFAQTCARCHGEYRKDWSRGTETIEVRYHARTPVVDVGTDSYRRVGMSDLADALNPLDFSQRHGVLVRPQPGYVPPPLEGIWARYPYLHNNSIPNLCVLMTPPEERPRTYYAGMPEVAGRDYDLDCVGYPTGAAVPAAWKKNPKHRFDSSLPGLSNAGHYDRIFRTADGKEKLTPEQKRDLREFLKTL